MGERGRGDADRPRGPRSSVSPGPAERFTSRFPPGWSTRPTQSPEAAARRELLEETGYAGGRWSSLLTLSANPALQSNLTYSFLAEGVEPVAAPTHEATEDLRVHVVPRGDLPRLIDTDEIVQALHAAPLLRYLLRRQAG